MLLLMLILMSSQTQLLIAAFCAKETSDMLMIKAFYEVTLHYLNNTPLLELTIF